MIALRMNQIKFTTTSQKAYELEGDVTGMNMAKNRKYFLNVEKQRGSQNTIKKLVIDSKERTHLRILRNSFQNAGTKN